VASTDEGATLWVVAAGCSSGRVVVARCLGAGAMEEMGEARLPLPTPPAAAGAAAATVTVVLAEATDRGGVIAVVGGGGGELYLLQCAGPGNITITLMERGAPGAPGSGSGSSGGETPGVGIPSGGAATPSTWGMGLAMSATKAALRFLREPLSGEGVLGGAVKSLAWMSSRRGQSRLLVLTATAIEEWEVAVGGSWLVQSHRALAPVKHALRSDGHVELISAAPAGPGESSAVVVLAAEGRRWSIHRAERRPGNASLALIASAVPPAGAVPSSGARRGGAAVYAGGVPADSALVVTAEGGAALFAGPALQDQLLLHDSATGGGRVLASAAAPSTGGWLILTELMVGETEALVWYLRIRSSPQQFVPEYKLPYFTFVALCCIGQDSFLSIRILILCRSPSKPLFA
jgi:nuclear pore complex protein Nup133